MKRAEFAIKWAVCWLALAMVGCTSAYTKTAAALIVAERAVEAAAEQFPSFDKAKRMSLVESAANFNDGRMHLDAWDVKAERITKAIEGAHASVQLGADGLKGVRDGLRDPKQLNSWVAPAIRVGLDLIELLRAVGLNLQIGAK